MPKDTFHIVPLDSGCFQSVFPKNMAEFSGIHITQSEAVSYIGEISLLYATKETLKTCLKGYLKIEPNPNEAYTQDLKAAMQTIDTAMKEA